MIVDPDRDRVLSWLRSIGLVVEEGERFFDSFAKRLWLDTGTLVVGDGAHLGDVIHEAGHLAVVPSRLRHLVHGDADDLFDRHRDIIAPLMSKGLSRHPEDPEARAILQASDHEVIAWSYAAALAVDIDPALCFENGFTNPAAGQVSLIQVQTGEYPGNSGLRAAGFIDSVKDFPKLKMWVQP